MSRAGSMASDRPPPPTRIPGAYALRRAEVSAPLIKRLRAEYGAGRVADDGFPVGDHPLIHAWLESLEVRSGK